MVISKNKLVKITPNIIAQICEYLDISLHGLSVKAKIDLKIIKKINNGDAVKIDTMQRLYATISNDTLDFGSFLEIDFKNISEDDFNINEKISIDGERSNKDIKLLRIVNNYDLSKIGKGNKHKAQQLFDFFQLKNTEDVRDILFNEILRFSIDFSPNDKETEILSEFDFIFRKAILEDALGSNRSVAGSSILGIINKENADSELQNIITNLAEEHSIFIYLGDYDHYIQSFAYNKSDDIEIINAINIDADQQDSLDRQKFINVFNKYERNILHISKRQEEYMVASVNAGKYLEYENLLNSFSFAPMLSMSSDLQFHKSIDLPDGMDTFPAERTYYQLWSYIDEEKQLNWYFGVNHKKLDRLDYNFDNSDDNFKRFIVHLIDYREEHGDCLVPSLYITSDGTGLGSMVFRYRSLFDRQILSQDKIKILNDLGFIWDLVQEDFKRGVEYLSAYKEQHGDCRVPVMHRTSDGFNLGNWVARRRRRFKNHYLSEDHTKILNDLGFIWDPLEEYFSRGVEYLSAYKEQHGDCRVQARHKTSDGFNLGIWVSVQRTSFNKKTLTEEKIKILDDLGFIWDAFEEDFKRGIEYLSAYKEQHGDCRVPRRHKTSDGFNLGIWVTTQRTSFKNKTLPEEKFKILNDLGFIWDPLEEYFSRGVEYLSAYKEQHGDCRVPNSHKTSDGFNLGAWVSRVRQNFKRVNLSEEKIKILNDLGFIWDKN